MWGKRYRRTKYQLLKLGKENTPTLQRKLFLIKRARFYLNVELINNKNLYKYG